MSPSMSTTVGGSRDERQPLDWLTGPTDPATQRWIDASVKQHDERRRQVEAACTGLQIGRADYGQRAEVAR